MTPKKHNRQYDLVVFGATGYTGVYIAEFITNSLPTNLRWAIAGRSRSKLEKIALDLKALNPERLQPDVEICGLNGSDLEALARKTSILITTVGPYAVSGEHAFKACAENGTHYLDVTGETPWVARMIKKYESTAQASGALMIPQIGIDSCLPDVVTYTLASLIRTELQAKTADVTVSVYRLNARPSGGTLASALGLFDSFSVKELNQSLAPFALSPLPNPRPPIKQPSLFTRLTGLRSVPHLGLQTTFIAGRTDAGIVERTWGLFSLIPSRKQDFYGPRFTFAEYLKASGWLDGIVKHVGLAVAGMLLMLLPPFRWLVKKLVTKPGDGPDKEAAKDEDIDYRGVATPDLPGSSNKMAYCRAHYVGSMYNLTALFVTQAAMTLLEDDVELGPGILTPACLGQGYIDRLETGGLKFESRLLDSQA